MRHVQRLSGSFQKMEAETVNLQKESSFTSTSKIEVVGQDSEEASVGYPVPSASPN